MPEPAAAPERKRKAVASGDRFADALADAARLAQSASDLDSLRRLLASFEHSPLKQTAHKLVFSDGNPQAPLMLIGEAPGRDEDLQGLPFVGRSGQLLNRMLAAINLDRQSVYISNILPWRPPGNRKPTNEEVAMFRPFVQKHIALVAPRLIVYLGGVAAAALSGESEGITRLRGRWLTYEDADRSIPAMATYHPAFLLRQPQRKKESWIDLQAIQNRLDALAG